MQSPTLCSRQGSCVSGGLALRPRPTCQVSCPLPVWDPHGGAPETPCPLSGSLAQGAGGHPAHNVPALPSPAPGHQLPGQLSGTTRGSPRTGILSLSFQAALGLRSGVPTQTRDEP